MIEPEILTFTILGKPYTFRIEVAACVLALPTWNVYLWAGNHWARFGDLKVHETGWFGTLDPHFAIESTRMGETRTGCLASMLRFVREYGGPPSDSSRRAAMIERYVEETRANDRDYYDVRDWGAVSEGSL